MPDYTPRLEAPRKRMVRDNWIKGVGGSLIALGSIGGGAYWYNQPQNPGPTTQQQRQDQKEGNNIRPQAEMPEWTEDDFGLRDMELEKFRKEEKIELEQPAQTDR